jgi:maltooligosyltrehalose trehalohydrolase
MVRVARAAAPGRQLYIVAENEPQQTRLVRPPERGGYGVDAMWNDDYHHTALVALTGRREAYYSDYTGTPQEFVSTAKYGFLFQGQWYSWQKQRRGTPALDLPGVAFVNFLENHDQTANSALGKRLHQRCAPGRYRALTALTLLGPATPMLFQGQEFGSTAPFLFFADQGEHLREAIATGRREFLAQFPSTTDPDVQAMLAPPGDVATFRRCKLDHAAGRDSQMYALHRDLLALRRNDPVIREAASRRVEGAVLTLTAFLLRYGLGTPDARLLVVNLGADIAPAVLPEPLLAPPSGCRWVVVWSSESAQYGGSGRAPLDCNTEFLFPGESAVLLRSEPERDERLMEADVS